MKTTRILGVAAWLLLAGAACAPAPVHGVIVRKEHTKETVHVLTVGRPASVNIRSQVPAKYELVVKDGRKTWRVRVSAETYERMQLGEEVTLR